MTSRIGRSLAIRLASFVVLTIALSSLTTTVRAANFDTTLQSMGVGGLTVSLGRTPGTLFWLGTQRRITDQPVPKMSVTYLLGNRRTGLRTLRNSPQTDLDESKILRPPLGTGFFSGNITNIEASRNLLELATAAQGGAAVSQLASDRQYLRAISKVLIGIPFEAEAIGAGGFSVNERLGVDYGQAVKMRTYSDGLLSINVGLEHFSTLGLVGEWPIGDGAKSVGLKLKQVSGERTAFSLGIPDIVMDQGTGKGFAVDTGFVVSGLRTRLAVSVENAYSDMRWTGSEKRYLLGQSSTSTYDRKEALERIYTVGLSGMTSGQSVAGIEVAMRPGRGEEALLWKWGMEKRLSSSMVWRAGVQKTTLGSPMFMVGFGYGRPQAQWDIGLATSDFFRNSVGGSFALTFRF